MTSRSAEAALHRLRLAPDRTIATEMVTPTLVIPDDGSWAETWLG